MRLERKFTFRQEASWQFILSNADFIVWMVWELPDVSEYGTRVARGRAVETIHPWKLDAHYSEKGGVGSSGSIFISLGKSRLGRWQGLLPLPCFQSMYPWDPIASLFITERLEHQMNHHPNGSGCIWSQPIKQINEQF